MLHFNLRPSFSKERFCKPSFLKIALLPIKYFIMSSYWVIIEINITFNNKHMAPMSSHYHIKDHSSPQNCYGSK